MTKEQVKAYNKQYVRTIKGFFSTVYNHQRERCRLKGWNMPDYTKQELIDKYMSIFEFRLIFKRWEESQYDTDLRPSFDRKDNKKCYTMDNIRLVTWEENNAKGKAEKYKRSVLQYSLEGKLVSKYISIVEANLKTGVHKSSIGECCRGLRPVAGGFKWKYNV